MDTKALASVESITKKILDLALEIAKVSYAAGVEDATEGAREVVRAVFKSPVI